jgi:hypothetical protein
MRPYGVLRQPTRLSVRPHVTREQIKGFSWNLALGSINDIYLIFIQIEQQR